MNNYYTLIYLIREWNRKLIGTYFVEAITTRKHTLELFFDGDEGSIKLTYSTDPQKTALFIDRHQPPKRANTVAFFESLESEKIESIKLAEGDRFISFNLTSNAQLIFLLYSSKSNVFLVKEGKVIDAFKKSELWTGKTAPVPQPAKSNEPIVTSDNFKSALSLDPLLPRTSLKLFIRNLASDHTPDLESVVHGLKQQLLTNPLPHISSEAGFSLISPASLGIKPIREFEDVNSAVAYAYYNLLWQNDFLARKSVIQKKLEQIKLRLDRSVEELEKLYQSLHKSGKFEKIGHLLMSAQHMKIDSDSINLFDFYDNEKELQVNVNPELSVVENAQRYYEKAKSARKSHETAQIRLNQQIIKREHLVRIIDSFSEISFTKDLEKWLKKYENDLSSYGLGAKGEGQAQSFFRQYNVDGFTIKVGKNAQSNDELLRVSHKEDIWLHARATSGSHVIIAMNRSTGFPPKSVLEKSAQIAAFFSKMKGSSLVPVIFTKRKFVRKPKGAAAGAAKVDREEVLLVKPSVLETD